MRQSAEELGRARSRDRTENDTGERLEGGKAARPRQVATHSWEYGWQWRAACRGEDSSLFFAPNHPETREEKTIRERQAKGICARCPVRIECLEYAIRIREPHGIWGGLNELERRILIRERERGSLRDVG
jgi:WhiB family transcriptional regulator, redox-sensing transcriptional regulator